MADLADLGVRFVVEGYENTNRALDTYADKAEGAADATDKLKDSQEGATSATAQARAQIEKNVAAANGLSRTEGALAASHKRSAQAANDNAKSLEQVTAALGDAADGGDEFGGSLLDMIGGMRGFVIGAVGAAGVAGALVILRGLYEGIRQVIENAITAQQDLIRAQIDAVSVGRQLADVSERMRGASSAMIAALDAETAAYRRQAEAARGLARARLALGSGAFGGFGMDAATRTETAARLDDYFFAGQRSLEDQNRAIARAMDLQGDRDRFGNILSGDALAARERERAAMFAASQQSLSALEAEAEAWNAKLATIEQETFSSPLLTPFNDSIRKAYIDQAENYAEAIDANRRLIGMLQPDAPAPSGGGGRGGRGGAATAGDAARLLAERQAAQRANLDQEDRLVELRAQGFEMQAQNLERELEILQRAERYREAGLAPADAMAASREYFVRQDAASNNRVRPMGEPVTSGLESSPVGQHGDLSSLFQPRGGIEEQLQRWAEEQSVLEQKTQGYEQYYAALEAMREADRISEEDYARARQAIHREEMDARLNTAHQMLGALANLQHSNNEKLKRVGKAAAIAQATIDGISAVMKAYAQYGPTPIGFAMAGVMGAIAAANVATIAALKDGGQVFGAGGGRDDAVLARLSAGEHVINASAASRNRPALNYLNATGRMPAEATRPVAANSNGKVHVAVSLDGEMLKAEIVEVSGPVAAQIATPIVANGMKAVQQGMRQRKEDTFAQGAG